MKQLKLSILTLMVLAASFVLGDYASHVVTGQTTIANNAADMSGKIVMVADSATGRTVTNLFTFDRGAAVPFAIGASSTKVIGLDADKLDGLDSTRFNWAEQTTTSTGTQNNFAITSGQNTVLYANNAALVTFTGFTAGTAGQHLKVVSTGAGHVNFTPQSASSTAGLRLINFATVGDTPLAAGSGTAEYVYDSGTARWRLVFHEQGGWITPTFAAGTYTANGTMTWTVAAGDVTSFAYRLSGRTLMVLWSLDATTVAGVLNNTLQITIPNSFVSTKQVMGSGSYSDAAASFTPGISQVGPAATIIQLFKAATANWSAAVDTTSLRGQIFFEVN